MLGKALEKKLEMVVGMMFWCEVVLGCRAQS